MRQRGLFVLVCLGLAGLLAAVSLVGCGGGGGGGDGSTSGGTGSLSVGLADATTQEFEAVYVTIREVKVHLGGDSDDENSWRTVASPEKTYNLLRLVNGLREELGIATLGVGHYTQMRLIIGDTPDDGINLLGRKHPYGNYFIPFNDTDEQELKIPSGLNTGIKIVHGFDINENDTTELVLDFDASKSIVKAGNSGKYLLKPTVKVLNTETCAIVRGKVTVALEGRELEGVLVSAQTSDSGAADPKDSVVVHTSTITDENGDYQLFLQPGTYQIVAYLDEYEPACKVLVTESDSVYDKNFQLSQADTGTVQGNVYIEGADDEQYATISFRTAVSCSGSDEEIEVKSVNVANGGDYEVELPVGTYTIVASTLGKATIEYTDIQLAVGGNIIEQDIDFQ